MLGIDIVDLTDPLLKNRSKDTLRFISHPLDFLARDYEHPFWYFWTAKEAVFKTKRELTSFEPKEIQIRFSFGDGELIFRSGKVHGKSFQEKQLIFSLASENRIDCIDYQVLTRKTTNASLEVRTAAKEYIYKQYGKCVNILHDGDGLPILDLDQVPISFSHHGKFIAFAFFRDSILNRQAPL